MQRHLGRGLGWNAELLCPLLDESGCMTVMVTFLCSLTKTLH